MAVSAVPQGSRLSLILQVGTDETGNPVYRTRSYSGVKPQATDQDVYDVAQMIVDLQQYPVAEILRVNDVELSEAF
ncbi:MAG TPA: hypothetical protein DEA47_04635 [Peptococcaceae bacterium]|nr:MAG: hypothetical protein XD50_1308 [Clostridia bacterium 41_269]HBT20631.1 hypothetical protein [Peptococcaceae bacterium]